MRFWIGGALALAWATAASAGDRVELGPVPAWVRQVPLTAAPARSDGSVTYLLADEQFRLEPNKLSSYVETVFRIDTPEGLSYGNISLPWQPETQTLTVHKLMIRRGDRVIDVLGSGQKFDVLRREANLESATLDGRLTATIQPEDLQVGDVITLATTVISSDPTYRGHVEQMANAIYSTPIGRHHVSAEWPASLAVRLRQTEGLPTLRPRQDGGMSRIDLTTDALQPPVLPRGAPDRFQRPRVIELSDFRDWSELAELFTPLYEKAAVIPPDSPLQAEIARIRAASADPKARAEAALALVQGRIRYVALLMGTGNFVPADAASTWNRRFGDCKAKSALLTAMLRALDIPADPVLVNSSGNDGLDARLPMVGLFDHVIVRAVVAGKTYWLDGTRTGDLRLDQIATPDFDWGLPLAKAATLVRMQPEQLDLPSVETTLRVDASKGVTLPAPVHAEAIIRGDAAYGMSVSVADLTSEARDRAARSYWKKRYAFVEIKSATTSYDPDRREMRFAMDGVATMEWNGGVYWLVDIDLGNRTADFERGPGEDRNAPFKLGFPYFIRSTETILLPPGVVPDDTTEQLTAGGVEYRRASTLAGNVYTVEASTRVVAPEFPAGEAAAAQKAVRALGNRNVALRLTNAYALTPAEIDQELTQTPQDAQQWARRSRLLTSREDHDGAIAALDKALALAPQDGALLLARGQARLRKKDMDGAAKDYAAAETIDPDTPGLAQAQGALASQQRRFRDALRYYDRAISASPDDGDLYGWRADARIALGDYAGGLRDSSVALKAMPDWIWQYVLRARAYRAMGDPDRAEAEAAAMLATNPKNADAHRAASTLYDSLNKADDAMRAIDGAIALQPTAGNYLRRFSLRRWSDIAGRWTDVREALRLEPDNIDALQSKADLQEREGDLAGALASLSKALKTAPSDSTLLAARAELHARGGRPTDATRDFAAAKRAAKTSADFNNLCFNRVIAGIDLTTALAECDRAIAADPDNFQALDGRGFALLKLARLDDAIRSYDSALRIYPRLPDSLLGRALAWAAKGDVKKASADYAAAIRLEADVVDRLRFQGASIPPSLAQASLAVAPTEASAPDSGGSRETDAALDGFTQRGMQLLGEMDMDGALAAFEAAVRKNPANAQALAGRGFVHAWQDDFEAATRDVNAAAVLDAEDSYVLRTRGYLAQKQRRHAEALRFYTRTLEKEPDDHTTYGWRAEVYRLVGDTASALRDADAATRLRPSWADMYFLRAQIYQKAGQNEKAFAEARAVVAAAPDNPYAHYQAAIIYNEGGRRDEALKAINRAIEIAPRADLFVSRMMMRADDDLASKRQDVEAALRFDPEDLRALLEKARLQEEAGEAAGALSTLSIALRAHPNDSRAQAMRGRMQWLIGRKEEAIGDFAAARASAKDGDDRNVLCWYHAMTDVDLTAALDDCQAALAENPDDADNFNGLAQVQLRLGQYDEAIINYGRALDIDSSGAEARYGRAIAWQRKGDAGKAEADRAAGIKADPKIGDTFRRSGLTM